MVVGLRECLLGQQDGTKLSVAMAIAARVSCYFPQDRSFTLRVLTSRPKGVAKGFLRMFRVFRIPSGWLMLMD